MQLSQSSRSTRLNMRTVAQFPDEMAYLAVEALIKVIEGRPVAPFIESPVVVITQDNLPE